MAAASRSRTPSHRREKIPHNLVTKPYNIPEDSSSIILCGHISGSLPVGGQMHVRCTPAEKYSKHCCVIGRSRRDFDRTADRQTCKSKHMYLIPGTWKCGSSSFIFTHPPEDEKKKKNERKKEKKPDVFSHFRHILWKYASRDDLGPPQYITWYV